MPGKSKLVTAAAPPMSPARKPNVRALHAGEPVLSEREVDEMLERIRIRGAKINDDLDALSTRLGLT